MTPKPTGWNRFIASLQGEVPAEELEAFRRASATVYELLERMEHRRLECGIDGLDPWTVPPATRTAFLCAWNAFVLQTLGDELLEADNDAPRVTLVARPGDTLKVRLVNDLPPAKRGLAMVFQSYALYPHKSVYDNMAFC